MKRQRTIFAEDVNMTEPPYGAWTVEVPTYYIRSSVLGGETLTEVNSTGRKIKTNIVAAGAKIATQSEYAYNTTTHEAVAFHHNDASAMSHRSTTASGAALYGDGQFDGAPAETDPMGGNMGTGTPYIEPELLPPPEEPNADWGFIPLESDAPMMVNGQRVTCTLDGMAIGCAQAQRAMEGGSAVACPNNNCGPITAYVNGRPTLSMPFTAYADGRSGWNIPIWYRNSITVGGQTTTFKSEIIGWRFQSAETSNPFNAVTRWNHPPLPPEEPRRTSDPPPVDFEALKKAITDCARLHFSKAKNLTTTNIDPVRFNHNGSISFTQGRNSFTVESGVDFDSGDLRVISGSQSAGTVFGMAFSTETARNQTTYTYRGITVRTDPTTANYVARNWAGVPAGGTGLSSVIGYGLTIQIHELGHSLMARYLGQSDYRNRGNAGAGGWQREIGWQFENCVFTQYTGGN